jgi:small GTP-binding protein
LTKIVQTQRHRIQLQLWDTAGQELFRAVTRGYYRGSAGALLVFDISNRESFDNIGKWLQDIRDVARSDVVTVLIGSKVDLADQRQVTTEEAQSFAKEHAMSYFETSAKTGTTIKECVDACVAVIEKNVDEGAYQVAQNQTGEAVDFETEDASKGCAC